MLPHMMSSVSFVMNFHIVVTKSFFLNVLSQMPSFFLITKNDFRRNVIIFLLHKASIITLLVFGENLG
jgi:hypothetical protein